MSTRRIECKGAAFMERVFAKMQEMYTHVEFLSYDGKFLTVAFIAWKCRGSTIIVRVTAQDNQ